MKHTDTLGTEIKVGDVVVSGNGKYADIHISMVTKRNPTMIRVGCDTQVHPSQCLVITDKYRTEFPQKFQEMFDKNKGFFETDAKKPNPTMRYLINCLTNSTNGDVVLVVHVLADGAKQSTILVEKELARFDSRYDDLKVVRTTEGSSWSRKLTDNLKTSTSGWPERKYVELPAKLIKKVFGGVPDTTTIMETFGSLDECKDYLKNLGVTA